MARGSKIHVVLTDVDLETSDECYYDYVQVYDGTRAVGSQSLGKFCDSDTGPRIIESETNGVLIKFRTDTSHSGRGFLLQYSTVCDTEVTGLAGVIESPNFPLPYPHNR